MSDLSKLGSADPQLHTKPTGQPRIPEGKRAGDLIDQHVKDNYAALNDEGTPYSTLADNAEKMGDTILTEYLRGEKDSDTHRETVSERERVLAAGERAGQTDRSDAPKGRTTAGGKQNG